MEEALNTTNYIKIAFPLISMNDKVLLRDDVISLVKSKGPILPSHVAKAINTNIIMASAYLSELVASKIINISNIKVGGSPLYYAQGQESQLLKFADNLNEKERRALELLKESRVLRDTALTPLMRVALREIKDFAVPLHVNVQGATEIFWKWHLIPNNEIEGLIKKQLEAPSNQQIRQEAPLQEAKPETPVRQEIPFKHEPKPIMQPLPAPLQPAAEIKKEPLNEQPAPLDKKAILASKQEQKSLLEEEIKEPREAKQKIKKDAFMDELIKFFEKNNIKITESLVVKKNSEIDFIVEIPSPVGNLMYYCKAKSKQRISDSDLSNAYVKGQSKKLPVLFLSSGELSKKAAEMLGSELKGLSFKKI